MEQTKEIKIKKKKFINNITPYLFISPWIIGFLVFTLVPLVFSLIMSVYNWPVIGTREFVGLGNYINMFKTDTQFVKSLVITLKFALIFVPLNLILALILALLITRPVKGVKIFRTIFYIPTVVSGVAISIIWGWILNSQYGILNYLLSLIGITGPRWLTDPKWAITAIVVASAWGVGTMMLIFYTAISSIPKDMYEAAYIDGASPVRSFFSITLPLITPTLLFNLITSTITALQQLTLALLLTNGGPMKSTYFYGLYVYNNAFKQFKLGYASANAWFMFVIILILTAIIFKSSDTWVFYENELAVNKKGGNKR
ncbi:carbohydrate ABC transporter permease [Clostridium sp. CF012]|uniref:carbohydrate ABC transporter permease n=1 Tax=Clostridium sp. CF012 TaxID=2843319 RepID=UPI00209B6CF2|nr:sugar ABC transporter permease [Clostridium sp. CF012]